MRNRRDYYAISVESRKGGVGKTIAALNLALKLVNSDKYEVVFLDLDITGTAAEDIGASLKETNIWKGHLHILPDPDGTSKSEKINMVSLFEKYMAGKPVHPVVWDREKKDHILMKSGVINIFSSFLRPDYTRGGGSAHVYAPEILFDEMHSEWFVAMIKDFIENSLTSLDDKTNKRKRKKELVLVIDNAPGYSGLEPAVNEWLTNLGPACGKFLFVCTLDSQDIRASVEAMRDIHSLYSDKWNISRSFIRAYKNKGRKIGGFESRREEVFFIRLAETLPEEYKKCHYPEQDKSKRSEVGHPTCTECGYCFYRVESKMKLMKRNTHLTGDECLRDPSRYIALIINKVPSLVARERMHALPIKDILEDFGIQDKDDITLGELSEYLENSKEQEKTRVLHVLEKYPQRNIPFNEAYSFQYFVDRLSGTNFRSNGDSEEATEAKGKKKEIPSKKLLLIRKMQNRKGGFSRLVNDYDEPNAARVRIQQGTLRKGAKIFTSFSAIHRKNLDECSNLRLRDVKEFWSDDFALISSFRPFLSAILQTFGDKHLSENAAQNEAEEITTKLIEANIINVDVETFPIIGRSLTNYLLHTKNQTGRKELRHAYQLAKAIAMNLGTAMTVLSHRRYSVADARALINLLLRAGHAHMDIIMSRPAKETEKMGINRWLVDEPVKARLQSYLSGRDLRFEVEKVLDLYLGFCNVQARLVTAKEDFHFLTDCICVLAFQEAGSRTLVGKVGDWALDVVVHKRRSIKEGLDMLKGAGLSEMREFLRGSTKATHIKRKKSNPLEDLLRMEQMIDFNNAMSSILHEDQWRL